MVPEIIIIGGGKSIQEGISLGLKDKIKDKFVIACNYAYKHFPHTILAFVDRDFYKPRPDTNYPDIYNELKKEPLIIGLNINGVEEFKLDNTILLGSKYREPLTGIFALNIAEKIIERGIIYLLGFDWTRRTGLLERDPNYNPNSDLQIHYYENIKHKGIGYVGYYENHNPDKKFVKFIKKDIKIYNVSLQSNINCFEKITYATFFSKLNNVVYNSNNLKQKIINLF